MSSRWFLRSLRALPGQTVSRTGTFSHPAGDSVTITASIGTVTQEGTDNGTWNWIWEVTEGQMVTITATDSLGATSETVFVVLVETINGFKWHDVSGDGLWDAGEPGLAGWEIYLDLNSNGQWDEGEPKTTTAADGRYAFANLDVGTYVVAEVMKDGWEQTYPLAGTHTVVLAGGQFVENLDFGNVQTSPDYFEWGAISDQAVGEPFPITIVAKSNDGSTVTRFNGPANLSGWTGGDGELSIGQGTTSWDYPMHTYYHDSRTQVIYLQSEIGSATTISGLALDVTAIPGQTMNHWTIRMKHTPLSSYNTASLDAAGWTTVYQGNETVTSIGWTDFVFSTPFEYNGSDNLLVDFSHNNSSWTSSGQVRSTTAGSVRSARARSDSQFGDPLNWSGTSSPTVYGSTNVPNVRLTVSPPVPVAITPEVTGDFVDGVWIGHVTVNEPGTEVYLRAGIYSDRLGDSNKFNVTQSGALTGEIQGHKWHDVNGDGVWDAASRQWPIGRSTWI
jgi:hypothetical protein